MVAIMRGHKRKSMLSSFWDTILKPDHEELEMKERLVVISAANQLQVGEFQLLQLAYREWYNKDLPEALVTKLFTSYMLHHRVPHWARHYARRIIDGYESGELDDNAPKFHRYDNDYQTSVPQGFRRFCVAAAGVIVAVFGSILVANEVVDGPASLLPPYFEKKDLPQVLPGMHVQKEHFIAPGGAGNFSDVKRPGR
ncbi:MAG: hypothetical protein CMM60_11175 [Rhodospirillaceae bacterium]|nr:hypothetical protein [Rhodospirillaceae bacterium]|tara:strand:+ start:4327 stop:4917 length:591 start_codon:yes stop_codon:yes gene_type:complete